MQRVTEKQQNLPASLSVALNPAQVTDSKYFTDKAFAINILAGKERIPTRQIPDSRHLTGSIRIFFSPN
jgi:hypothetical protein